MSIVFLFPGQGSQEVGMGADLFKGDADGDSHFRGLVERASDVTHENLEKLCLHGPDRKLRKAQFLQPLLAAVSLGYLFRVRQAGIRPSLVLGHSLGEITSLAASGVVSDEDAVLIAAKRGEFMDEAASRCSGTMMAALFMPLATVNELLAEMNKSSGLSSGIPDRIVLANDNAPDQIVLSGDTEALEEFSRRVSGRGLGKCKSILVSGPWHSPFMAVAHERFKAWVSAIRFSTPSISIMLNGTARCETDPEVIRQLVTDQLVRPVQWRQCMEAVRGFRPDALLEIGPGRILSGLVRVNGFPKKTVVYNVNNLAGLQRAAKELSEKTT